MNLIRQKLFFSTLMFALAVISAVLSPVSQASQLDDAFEVEITVTNLSKSQSLTPPLLAISEKPVRFYEVGKAAYSFMEVLAESGNRQALGDVMRRQGGVVYGMNGSIPPFATQKIRLTVNLRHYLHFASQVQPTNDAFVGINGMKIWRFLSEPVTLKALDAGTELNSEKCRSIPGAYCQGQGENSEGGEGMVHPHPGIHGAGDLDVATFAWENPIAQISVRVLERL